MLHVCVCTRACMCVSACKYLYVLCICIVYACLHFLCETLHRVMQLVVYLAIKAYLVQRGNEDFHEQKEIQGTQAHKEMLVMMDQKEMMVT